MDPTITILSKGRAHFNPLLPTVNWGSWADYPCTMRAPELNPPAVVRRNSNKYNALVTMASAGIKVPQHWPASTFSTLSATPGSGPRPWSTEHHGRLIHVVPRNSNHRGGQDIVDCCAGTATPDFFTQYIVAAKEYRIHVALWLEDGADHDAAVIAAQRKVPREGESFSRNWPRTHSRGYVFHSFQPQDREARLYQTAIAAVRALGLDFGAVDVVYSADDSEYYVLEVNSAPGADSLPTIEFYTQALAHWSPIRRLP